MSKERKAAPVQGLTRVRRYINLSQRELAKRIGYQASTIRLWESGERSPNLFAARAIVDTINRHCEGKGYAFFFTIDDIFPA